MNGGSMTAQRIWLGNNSNEATFHMNGGNLTVTGDFQIADHDWTDAKSTFTQTGGAVSANSNVTMTLGDTADEDGWAKYELLGGTLTLNNASTPFVFSANPAPIYFEFDYGSPDLGRTDSQGHLGLCQFDESAQRRLSRARFAGHAQHARLGARIGRFGRLHYLPTACPSPPPCSWPPSPWVARCFCHVAGGSLPGDYSLPDA